MQNHAFSDGSGSPRNKYWHGFMMKNQSQGPEWENRDGVDANHTFFDGSGPNLAHVFFISQKQILALFHFEKPTQWQNGGRGGV